MYPVFVYFFFCGFRGGLCGIYNLRLKLFTSFEILLHEYVTGCASEQVFKLWEKKLTSCSYGEAKYHSPVFQTHGIFSILTELIAAVFLFFVTYTTVTEV